MTPKGHQGIDWQGIGALLGLGMWILVYVALIFIPCVILAHFIIKYW